MTITLFANIGNSDLALPKEQLMALAGERKFLPVRVLGEVLFEKLTTHLDHLTMPLLIPTLRWLWQQRPFEGNDLHVVLFASDQPEYVPADERAKDTKPHADVIKALLMNSAYLKMQLSLEKGINIPKRNITVESIKGSPADYANMLAFYMDALPKQAQRIADESEIYLEISGGTPAMTAMLVVAAVETFGPRVRTLYVDRGATESYEVAVAQQLFAQRTRHTLRTQINLYSYTVALQTVREQSVLISRDQNQQELITVLLYYADRRLAFDFDEARLALQQARRLSVGEEQSLIQYWLNTLSGSETSDLLAELLHSIAVRNSFGDYAFFVQQLFRFQEAALHFMAHAMGMPYKSAKTDEYLDPAWLEEQPGLIEFSQAYQPLGSPQQYNLNLRESLSRLALAAIVDYLLQQGVRTEWAPAATALHSLSRVAELRNRGLSGHGFQGISRQKVETAYGQPLPNLLEQLREIYQIIFRKAVGDSPYDQVNQLLHRFVAEA